MIIFKSPTNESVADALCKDLIDSGLGTQLVAVDTYQLTSDICACFYILDVWHDGRFTSVLRLADNKGDYWLLDTNLTYHCDSDVSYDQVVQNRAELPSYIASNKDTWLRNITKEL